MSSETSSEQTQQVTESLEKLNVSSDASCTANHDHSHDHHDHHDHHDLHDLSKDRSASIPMTASELSAEHQALLHQMIAKVLEHHPDHSASEYTYLRFLRARKFNVEAAVEMYLKYLKWRTVNRIDEVIHNPPTEVRNLLLRIMPENFHKFDKFGLPAYFVKAGKVHTDLLLKYMTSEDLVKSHIWGMEYSFQRAAESSARHGRNIDQFINIVDLSGLSMYHRKAIAYMKGIAKMDNQYYPEALGKTYVINAPWVFPALWKLVSNWIDPVTRSKIHVLSTGYEQVLLERFHAEDLPKEYGGKCECEGGCIPVHSEESVKKYAEAYEAKKKLVIAKVVAGKTHEIKVRCGELGGIYECYFRALRTDIAFHCSFFPDHPKDEHHKEIHWKKYCRNPYPCPSKFTFESDCAGTAVFTFDNKHSYWYTEDVGYSIDCLNKTADTPPRLFANIELEHVSGAELDELDEVAHAHGGEHGHAH